MIAYLFLALGTAGTAAAAYWVVPAARGAHRYVVPRSQLRATIAALEARDDDRVCKLLALTSELDGTYDELRTALASLETSERRAADLARQVADAAELRQEVTQLRAALANATAVRPLPPARADDADASVLPDAAQEFTDTTATAWRVSA